MTNKGRDMIDRGRIVNRFESENWSIIVSEVDNFIKVNVQGKRDHRDRVMWWKQSRRLFPEIRDEDDER
jgi:hypothetical protein